MRFAIANLEVFVSLVILPYTSHARPLSPFDEHHVVSRGVKPCREVRDQVSKWFKDNNVVPKNFTDPIFKMLVPSVPAVPIRPSLAFACLKSVPLHKDTALAQLDFLGPVFEWQSTIDYLKRPPEGYLSEGVDLLRGLDDIRDNLSANKYKNEFEFLGDVHTLSNIRSRDGHFSHTTLLFGLFDFVPGVMFLSVSEDGLASPDIYVAHDTKHSQHQYTPSPVSTINGVPALKFLQELSLQYGGAQDPDARFNGLLPSVAKNALAVSGGFNVHTLGHGLKDTTTVKFRNGTVSKYENTAYVLANFTDIASGEDLFRDYGSVEGTAPMPVSYSQHQWSEKNFTINREGYPDPYSITDGEIVRTFLPSGSSDPALGDTAVLAVNSFYAVVNPYAPLRILTELEELHNVTSGFLAEAKASGRKKLIVDLQGNVGGLVSNLMVLYFNLFPPADGNLRLPLLHQVRAHPQLQWLGEALEKQAKASGKPFRMPWTMEDYIQPDGTPWPSFRDWYGPVDGPGGGQLTRKSLWNVTDVLTSLDGRWRYSLPYGEAPFRAEDMVVVTDGNCASACAILAAMLTHVHGVRTVTLGGRPRELPMQAVGEVRGGPVGPFNHFRLLNVSAIEVPDDLRFGPLQKPALRILSFGGTPPTDWDFNVNVGNMFPLRDVDDESAVPLQLRYEAANCRLFYTWEMASDITAIWRAVKAVAWDGKKCVRGSTTNADGTIGGVVGYTAAVEDEYKLPKGPGSVKN